MRPDSIRFANSLTASPLGSEDPPWFGLRPASLEPALRVAIVTMTCARSPAEGRLLQRTLRTLSKTGFPIYVGEGGSSRDFIRGLRRLPNLHACSLNTNCKPTSVNQLRAAFVRAEETHPDYLLYTEPDKRAFFAHGLPMLIQTAALGSPRPRLVLAARTLRGFATFPKGQQIAEGFMNRLCGEALGQLGDYTYGPMLICDRLLKQTPPLPENLGWGWRFFLMAVAHQLRKPVVLRTVRTQSPASQRDEDDAPARDYRLRQLIENVTGLANGWTCLLDQPAQSLPALVTAA
jgi:hypothetical protein